MAVKALVSDASNTRHLIIGLSRDNMKSLLSGEVFVLPRGDVDGLTDESDVVLGDRR